MLGLSIEINSCGVVVPARECARLLRVPASLAAELTSGVIPERVVLEGIAYSLRLPSHLRSGKSLTVLRGSRLIQLESESPTLFFAELVTGLIDFSAAFGTVIVSDGQDYVCASLLTGEF